MSKTYSKSKGMRSIFQKTGKIFENIGKNVQNLKMFLKRTGDCVRYRMQ